MSIKSEDNFYLKYFNEESVITKRNCRNICEFVLSQLN